MFRLNSTKIINGTVIYLHLYENLHADRDQYFFFFRWVKQLVERNVTEKFYFYFSLSGVSFQVEFMQE